MIEILNKLDVKDLYHALGSEKITQLEKLLEDTPDSFSLDTRKLSKIILATYGNDLLYDSNIRHLIFTLINKKKLKYITKKYAKKVYEKTYDNALALSILPWKSNSEFVIEVAKELNIPKEFLPLKLNINQTVEIIEPIEELFDLHDYQKELKNSIVVLLSSNKKRFLIQMPTGAGKTRTVIESILTFNSKKNFIYNQQSIIWIAHTEELCEQAIDTFKDIWQHKANYPTQVVRFWGNYNPNSFEVLGSFVVGTFQKFYSLLQNKSEIFESLKKASRIVIVDEAHKSTAPSYSKVINSLISNKHSSLIGVTATPGRSVEKGKENIKLATFYDKNLITPHFSKNPIIELREKKILSKLNRKIIHTGIIIELKKDDINEIEKSFDLSNTFIKKIAKNITRNRIILKVIREELINKNPCLVFTCSIDHAKILSTSLNYQGYKSSYIDCNIKKGSRKRIIDGFRKGKYEVLFNYGVLSTGFDAPRIRTIIITRPTASVVLYSQMIGRGLRGPKMGGAEFCNLIDIKDNFKNFGGVENVYTYFEDYWK